MYSVFPVIQWTVVLCGIIFPHYTQCSWNRLHIHQDPKDKVITNANTNKYCSLIQIWFFNPYFAFDVILTSVLCQSTETYPLHMQISASHLGFQSVRALLCFLILLIGHESNLYMVFVNLTWKALVWLQAFIPTKQKPNLSLQKVQIN